MTTDTTGGATNQNSGHVSYIKGCKVTASASGQIITLGFNKYGTISVNVRLALYSHDAGNDKPGSLLGETASFAAAAAGWYDQAPTSLPNIVQGTIYWIAFQYSNGNAWMYSGTGGRRSQATYSFGAFPATWPASSEYTVTIYNLRMTYAPNIVAPTVTTDTAIDIGLD
jgi:hypothetical protein